MVRPQIVEAGQAAPKAAPRRGQVRSIGLLWIAPALGMYAVFVLYPLSQTVRYSLYDWNGISDAKWVGVANYIDVVTDPTLFGSLLNALILVAFFTIIPVSLGLVCAATIRDLRSKWLGATARTVLFLPQIVPFAAAAVAWTWIYADGGPINAGLRSLGLTDLARPWLGDFGTALPAVGLIGAWVMLGFCTVLLSAGLGRIDASLYEAARLDGANALQEFFAVTVPGVRHEIVVCATVTLIAAISTFDIVFMTTKGGPGFSTMVPGVQIVLLAFTENRVGLASALSVVLLLLMIAVVLPIQRLNRR